MKSYGIIYVVETQSNRYMGRIESSGSTIKVYSGYQGRPPVIPIEEIDSMVPAATHPDVEGL